MKERLHVLLSAYSCEPGKGSEPEVGWQWVRQMARWHDVTVLTRANNEPAIRAALAAGAEMPRVGFVYHDLAAPWLRLKKQLGLHGWYYRRWQASAREVIARLTREMSFDLVHHVTYAGARFPAAIFGHGVPAIWGPVGGFESMPAKLLPWRYPRELVEEVVRNMANAAQKITGALGRRAAQASLTIASTKETAAVLAQAGVRSHLLPTIGIRLADFTPASASPADHLRLLFSGRLLYWKGVELAIRAVHAAETNARLTLMGCGRFRKSAEALVRELGLQDRIEFRGQVTRSEMLAAYAAYDALLFPSMHDTGGFVLLEAMATALPVICLACAGPALAVPEGCGLPVPLGARKETIAGLAAAIRRYAEDPGLRREHGAKARQHVSEHYEWDRKGEKMNSLYAEVLAR